MTSRPSLRVIVLGVILFGTMVALARLPGGIGSPLHLIALGVAAVTYLIAIREFGRTPKYPSRVILTCLMMAAAWQIPFILAPIGPQDDVLRYVWDGRLQRLGFNPYLSIPSDPALAALHTSETRGMNNQDVPSPYPAGAQLFFRTVTAINDSAFAFKVASAACNLLIVLLLFFELRRRCREHWVLAYAWHPLLVTGVSYHGHIDILGVLLLLVSVMALQRRWPLLAAVTFGLAITVKYLPAVLAPLYWRRVGIRDALLAAIIAALLYVPFLGTGAFPIGSIGTFVQRFRFNDPVFAVLEQIVRPQVAAGIAVLCGLVVAILLRSKCSNCSPDLWAWPMAASLVCSPVIYPWYLLWLLPFLDSTSTIPLMIWTLSIHSVFYTWYSYLPGHPWQVSGWVLLLEFGPVALGVLLAWVRRRVNERA